MDISLAPLYLLYGNALLEIAISKSTISLVNPGVVPKQLASAIVGDMHKAAKESQVIDFGEEQSNSSDSNEPAENDDLPEPEDDHFQSAWETLDTARLIYERDQSMSVEARSDRLTEVYGLLGDLSMENGTRYRLIFQRILNRLQQTTKQRLITNARKHPPLSISALLLQFCLSRLWLSITVARPTMR